MALTAIALASFGIITRLDQEMDQWLENHEYVSSRKHEVTQLTQQEHDQLDSLQIITNL